VFLKKNFYPQPSGKAHFRIFTKTLFQTTIKTATKNVNINEHNAEMDNIKVNASEPNRLSSFVQAQVNAAAYKCSIYAAPTIHKTTASITRNHNCVLLIRGRFSILFSTPSRMNGSIRLRMISPQCGHFSGMPSSRAPHLSHGIVRSGFIRHAEPRCERRQAGCKAQGRGVSMERYSESAQRSRRTAGAVTRRAGQISVASLCRSSS